MASKEVTVREWTCDGCGTTIRSENAGRDLPSDWTTATTTINIPPGGPYTKVLELCPTCSQDREAAAKRYKTTLGR